MNCESTDLRMHRLRTPLVLMAALTACACATQARPKPPRIAIGESGFTISEKLRLRPGTRSDFTDAVALLSREQYEAGIAVLRQVTEAAPHATAAHIDLAIAQLAVGDLQAAESSLHTALELIPRHPVAHNELGILYRKTGRFEQARSSYESALQVYPDFHFARRNLAILCDLYLADLTCALENYELYAQAVPEDETIAIWIADLRNRAGQ